MRRPGLGIRVAWLWKRGKALFRNFRRHTQFDPIFYYSHYDDLRGLRNLGQLRRHYRKHGRPEGRFPNEYHYIESIKKRILSSPDEFDLIAYKHFNKDLLTHFQSDDQFVEHYARYGVHEGRISRFSSRGASEGDSLLGQEEKWRNILSPAQVAAWISGLHIPPPASRQEAIDLFLEQGVDDLWPINFEYRFDPHFYRQVYGKRQIGSVAEGALYREWLRDGFPAGRAPNEEIYLYPLLGGSPYPAGFDWQGYAAHARLGAGADRFDAIRHLFDKGSDDIAAVMVYLGENPHALLGQIGCNLLIGKRFKSAIAALEAAVKIEPSAEYHCLLGDCYVGLRQNAQALQAYLASIDHQSSDIRPYLHVVEARCGAKDFLSAFAALRGAHARWRHRPEYTSALERCVERYFEHQSAEAHVLFRRSINEPADSAAVREANDLLRETMGEIEQLYSDLTMLPAPIAGQGGGHVLMLANDDLPQCTHYRVEQKRYQFEAAGVPLKVFSHSDVEGFLNNLVGAKAVIFYRVAATPRVVRVILQAKLMGLQTYYEMDDLIFDPEHYPNDYASYEEQITPEDYAGLRFGVPLFRYAMGMCDHGIASTPALAEEIRRVTRTDQCLLVRNALDERNTVAVQLGTLPRTPNSKVRIFYGSGSKAHNANFNHIVGPALIDIMLADDRVEIVIVGYLALRKEFEQFKGRILTYPFVSDLDPYWSLMSGCDINIAVLNPGLMSDCKSEIKWLEAAVLQIPSVVSDTATYREVIEDGIDGFLASNSAAWRLQLAKLINDAELRREAGARARAKALEIYDLARAAAVWKREFSDRRPGLPAPRKPRILICNVFFHPQSIGGATRVVEDNISYFLRSFPDTEWAVCCSEEDDTAAGRLRMTNFRGMPVYRISAPAEPDIDWRPFNPANGAAFERVLDHFKPDLVHFHCIQRLTASIVEVTLKRRVPYVVTLHDGWWISDHQFLIDDDGFLKLPTNNIFDEFGTGPAPIASIERRQRLGALLNAASARLTVSRSFSRVYEGAGIRDIRMIENGVSPLPRRDRVRHEDGRVHLGHIGGRATHKGAFLIEAALRQENYHNLHLTMIDGKLAPEQTVATYWGSTPVTLVGPYPQTQVSDLYAQLNVLLAPSTWPESFGLVTREALSQGCWVVASDQGAIGEGIVEGENGHVIDTRTLSALKRVLAEIDGAPERYRQEPSWIPTLRPTEWQARELHGFYSTLFGERRPIE